MKLAYYPGCSLEGTALDYDRSIKDICGKLNIELAEITDWNCCGASSAHMTNHEIGMRLAMRNLLLVKDDDLDILVPCAACYQRLKAADKAMKANPDHWDTTGYSPQFEIVHISTLLSRPEVVEQCRALVNTPVKDMPVACYYGCLSLRPPHITDARDHEMPNTLETIVAAVGAKPLFWSHRTECCSGSLTMTRPDIARQLVGDIVRAAKRAGAKAMVTDCPMCQANVESRQLDLGEAEAHLPVFYAAELLAAAFNGTYPEKQKKVHLVPADVLTTYFQAAEATREEPV